MKEDLRKEMINKWSEGIKFYGQMRANGWT
jgi:hypothetical protein